MLIVESKTRNRFTKSTIFILYLPRHPKQQTVTHTLANQYQIQVATSDAQEQNIILGAGAMRMSAKELLKEMEHFHHQTLNSLVYQPRFQHMALSDLRKWNEVHDEDDE